MKNTGENTGVQWLGQFASLRKVLPSNVYLLKCEGYYKVGIADDVTRRLNELQVGNPFPIEVVHSFTASRGYCEAFEDEWHWRLKLAGAHVRGEWFKLTPEQVEEVKQAMNPEGDNPLEHAATLEVRYGTED